MIVRVTTELPIPARTACGLACKPHLLRYVMWPLVGIGGQLPERVTDGDEIVKRLYLLSFLPGWKHRIQLVSLGTHEISTREGGRPVRVWNHRLLFEETSDSTCRYTDEVEIDAGLVTAPMVAFAHLLYRWRHRRWQQLAVILA